MAYEYIENFKKMGFGMFNHFGLYSILGKGEWVLSQGKIDHAKYNELTKKFKVKKDWAKQLVKTAKAAGCKYITLTTRHHDGFSLYDTKGLNDFDAPHSAAGRDLIKEFVDECNKEGIVPFFYHTLLDWYNPDYKNDFPKYIDYLVKSIEILCTQYGKIGGFWFDGMWDKPNDDWQEDRLYGTIRKYQPEAMIINNTGLSECGKTGHREIDSVTFERGKAFFVDTSEKPLAGEVCEALTDHWGYTKEDICVKSPKELVEMLIDCRKFNCNLLLNTGLMGNGLIPEGEKANLLAVGKWIKVNKGFIYDAVSAGLEAENADLLTDGKYYYAVIRNVPMSADPNVSRLAGGRTVTIKTDKKVVSVKWLDNGKSVKGVKKNSIPVEPFAYGYSYGARVARFELK
ncbi:MAG: alpha-L-fucosidase [Clostridia bacterium]|nr:alpha-L-fucosidase [Clostridia bacterium]